MIVLNPVQILEFYDIMNGYVAEFVFLNFLFRLYQSTCVLRRCCLGRLKTDNTCRQWQGAQIGFFMWCSMGGN